MGQWRLRVAERCKSVLMYTEKNEGATLTLLKFVKNTSGLVVASTTVVVTVTCFNSGINDLKGC